MTFPRPTRIAVAALAVVAMVLSPAAAGVAHADSVRTAGDLHWIVEEAGTQDALTAIGRLDPELARTSFGDDRTDVLSMTHPPRSSVPASWSSVPAYHYTSYGPCTTGLKGCASLSTDLGNGTLQASGIPAVMYDDENWSRTPPEEKSGVCAAMRDFTDLAHQHGLRSIMAPDQNLASPGVITTYQGGESENWQTYLRLGLGSCAGASGTDAYHVMSQPFQTHWCGGQGGACEGSEADFTDFVTQAAAQAKAVEPDVTLTAGLSTNPRYNVTPQALYQDSIDVERFVDGFWLNVAGNPSNPGTAVQYLEMLDGMVPYYLGDGGALSDAFPDGATPRRVPLDGGRETTFTTSRDVPGGTVIPAGDYKFEPWANGSDGTAILRVEVGYCRPPDCTDRTPIVSPNAWRVDVPAGDPGVTNTHSTASATRLPADGPYRLYTTIHVETPAAFSLLYGTGRNSTNLAVPRPSSEPVQRRSAVVFAHRGGVLGTRAPAAAVPSRLGLDRAGNTVTFTSAPVLHPGETIPAGAWQFQYWTGAGAGSAVVRLEAGYCSADCRERTPIIGPDAGWRSTVTAGARGGADSGGAATTTDATVLPGSGGPYRLYWRLVVEQPGPVELRYDAERAPTNLATPLPLPVS